MKRLGLRLECGSQDTSIIWQVLANMKCLDGLWLELHSDEMVDIVPLMPALPGSLRVLIFHCSPVDPEPAEEFMEYIFDLPHLMTLCLPSSSLSRYHRFKFMPINSDDDAKTFGAEGTEERWSELKIATLGPDDFDDPNMGWFAPMIVTWRPPSRLPLCPSVCWADPGCTKSKGLINGLVQELTNANCGY
ncbi:hypothetical protein V8B97DRAFT_718770 [Scleroderma yunnanense]